MDKQVNLGQLMNIFILGLSGVRGKISTLFCLFFITKFLQYSSLLEFYDNWVISFPKIYNMYTFPSMTQAMMK